MRLDIDTGAMIIAEKNVGKPAVLGFGARVIINMRKGNTNLKSSLKKIVKRL